MGLAFLKQPLKILSLCSTITISTVLGKFITIFNSVVLFLTTHVYVDINILTNSISFRNIPIIHKQQTKKSTINPTFIFNKAFVFREEIAVVTGVSCASCLNQYGGQTRSPLKSPSISRDKYIFTTRENVRVSMPANNSLDVTRVRRWIVMRIDRKSERHVATRKVAARTRLQEITSDAGDSKSRSKSLINVVPSVARVSLEIAISNASVIFLQGFSRSVLQLEQTNPLQQERFHFGG